MDKEDVQMKLTIFTPTYNRADKLFRVYDSLKNQTCFNFEWLIIDDGSTDNTENIVYEFTQQQLFQVKYIKKNNGGKHRAYNLALQNAMGDLFLCLDSDDWLKNDAVENILNIANSLDEKQFIVAYKMSEKDKSLSDTFPDIRSCSLKQLSQEYNCNGEFSLIFPTKLASMFPFPEFDGERFITEAVVYDRINYVANAVLLPKTITICEYQEDGLSNNLNTIMKNNPAGYCLYFMQRIDYENSFVKRFITAGKYQCFWIFAKNKKTDYIGKHKLLTSMARPLGLVFNIYYKFIRGFE